MNRDDIIRLAIESGFSKDFSGVYHSCGGSAADSDLTPELERFAALVAAAERDACAKVADEIDDMSGREIAANIRARGEA